MTREDYINKIKQAFLNNIASHSQEFKSHDYFNDNYKTYWKDFFNNLKEVGLAFGNCYHAHNIGNNNEWDLMIQGSVVFQCVRLKHPKTKRFLLVRLRRLAMCATLQRNPQ